MFRYESCIDVEIQQRAVEYFALSRKGAALMDILAEMPKFPERQVCLWASYLLRIGYSIIILNSKSIRDCAWLLSGGKFYVVCKLLTLTVISSFLNVVLIA